MPYTVEDYQKDYASRYVHRLPPGELLAAFRKQMTGLTHEEKKVYLEDVLKAFKGLSREEMLAALMKQPTGLSPEEQNDFMEQFLDSDK